MDNQLNYQIAYADFVMDQRQPILENNFNQQPQALQQNAAVRTRINFSRMQLEILETEFRASPYIYKSQRNEIAKRLGVEDKQVKVWFQNRRMKCKKEIPQNGNAVTNQLRYLTKRPNDDTKKPEQIPIPNPLPVHKPIAAQLMKGVPHISAYNKAFKPQLIVQMPASVSVPQIMQPSTSQSSNVASIQHHPQKAAQIYPQIHLRQQPTQEIRYHPYHLTQRLHHQLPQQQQVPVQQQLHQVQQAIEVQQYQSPQHVSQNPDCSEDSVDLDNYLHEIDQRVVALRSDQGEAQKMSEQQQQQQSMMIPGLTNLPAISPEMSSDIGEFMDSLDKYLSPETAPELNFDAQDLNSLVPTLEWDSTLDLSFPMVHLSLEDCLDTSFYIQ